MSRGCFLFSYLPRRSFRRRRASFSNSAVSNVILKPVKIILRPHLKIRLEQRLIPQDYPKKIISHPEEHYFDTLSNRYIAIKTLPYSGKLRPMVVAYDIIGETIEAVTIHPTDEQEINNKLQRGRWIKNEKN